MDRATVLTYHNIGSPPKGRPMRSLYVTTGMFRFQMWYLKAAGFRVVSLGEIADFAMGKGTRGKLVALTFDDGFEDFYEHAYPVLRRYNYPSTIFIVAGLVGKHNAWDNERIKEEKPLLAWNKIAEIKKGGVTIGSHTTSHPSLLQLSAEELESETASSKSMIEERLGSRVDYFCYPYGDYNNDVLDATRRAGYRAAVTTKKGHVHKGDDPYQLSRISVKLQTHPLSLLYKMHLYERLSDRPMV